MNREWLICEILRMDPKVSRETLEKLSDKELRFRYDALVAEWN